MPRSSLLASYLTTAGPPVFLASRMRTRSPPILRLPPPMYLASPPTTLYPFYPSTTVDTYDESFSEPLVTIDRTAFTKVLKIIRNNTAFAVKVCRKPDSKKVGRYVKEEQSLGSADHTG
jgi:hypothetical protein